MNTKPPQSVAEDSIVRAKLPDSGLGNRLFGLAACRVFASMTRSDVECVWSATRHCPGHFTDVFDVPEHVEFVDTAGNVNCRLVASYNPVRFWSSHRAELRGMPLLEFLRRVRWEIRELKFTPDVTEQGSDLLKRHGTTAASCLAVHWRGTDRFRHNKRMIRRFDGGLAIALRRWPLVERLEIGILPRRLLERHQLERTRRAITRAASRHRDFLIAADDLGIGALLAEHVRSLGGQAIMFEREGHPTARRRASLRAAGIDLWLLSNAAGIIGTDFNSSFLAVACIRARHQPLNGDVRFISEIFGEALI